jgi:hypothetical protein
VAAVKILDNESTLYIRNELAEALKVSSAFITKPIFGSAPVPNPTTTAKLILEALDAGLPKKKTLNPFELLICGTEALVKSIFDDPNGVV